MINDVLIKNIEIIKNENYSINSKIINENKLIEKIDIDNDKRIIITNDVNIINIIIIHIKNENKIL